MKITKIELDEKNRMVRIGGGKHDGNWFFRVDLWSVGFRLHKEDMLNNKAKGRLTDLKLVLGFIAIAGVAVYYAYNYELCGSLDCSSKEVVTKSSNVEKS